ncbi:paraquat-inducible protein A [Gallaecimonas mangrovi]|uniref:paraquat-inducible protein A n=1 Tax=Gallaecimonas mangrovi TaxID=2291597 RepID=UPI000E201B3E|nr:paraquat-inducible protein A [Gallaecimonas mangrovi]
MPDNKDLIICEHCDSVWQRPNLAAHQQARCSCCGAKLYRGSRLGIGHWLALTLAAFICFLLANLTPIIHINYQGLHNDATLWQAAYYLAQGPELIIAIPTALVVILVPGLQLLLLLWLLLFACRGRCAPGHVWALKTLRLLKPWSMVEVALLSALVAVVKLAGYLTVSAGTGIWALAALMLLLIGVTQLDLQRLWALTER